ncbi:unnamed protein product [Knipowitschia caucasica]
MAEVAEKAEAPEETEDYEKLFAHRFTSEDREYQEYLKRPPDPPPIVENWRASRNHRGRDRYQDRRGRGGHGWGGGGRDYGGWRGEQRQQQWHDRDRDRSHSRDPHRSGERSWDRDRPRAYQPHPPGSSHGYSQGRY